MNDIEQFIDLHKKNIACELQAIKNWEQNAPDAPHEYKIFNNAFAKGQQNLLNKLEEWLNKK